MDNDEGSTDGKAGSGRRDFLKTTATGLGGFATERQPDPDAGRAGKFAGTRVLGRTDIQVPIVSINMNTDNPQRRAASMPAMSPGHRPGYQRGTNEAMIGEILKGRPRSSFFIATKASLPKDQATGGYGPDATEEAYTKKIDTSLAPRKAKQAGKIRWIGVSTHRNEPGWSTPRRMPRSTMSPWWRTTTASSTRPTCRRPSRARPAPGSGSWG
jgi:hypothetical protein